MKLKKKGIAGHWKRATGHLALLFMSSCSAGIIMQSYVHVHAKVTQYLINSVKNL